MKLVFVAAEQSPVMLGQGIHRIGSSESADIMLSGEDILPQHAELYVGPHGVSLRPASDAGVAVNGQPVGGLIAVRAGDTFSVGGIRMRLEALPSTAAANADDSGVRTASSMDAAPQDEQGGESPAADDDTLALTRVQPALPKFVLRGVSSVGFGRTFPVVGPTVVGRAGDCDIHIDHPGLSRHQARLTPTSEGLLVEDLGSTNGTLLNEKKVDRAVARHGDELGFDVMRFRLVSTNQDEAVPPAAATQPPAVEQPAQARGRFPLRLGIAAAVILLVVLAVWLL